MTMLDQIKGLHHVTSMATDARQNNQFFTDTLGLRRVKKTVNFDAPDVYHLYYGDEVGTPGSVMTYFPFPHIGTGPPGTGEVGTTAFSVPQGSLGYWKERLAEAGRRRPEDRDAASAKSACSSPGPMATASRWSRPRTTTVRPGSKGGVPARPGDPRLPLRVAAAA